MKYLYVLLTTCFFYSAASSQIIQQKGWSKFEIEGQTYKKKQLAFVFNRKLPSYQKYKRSLNQSKTSKLVSFISLGTFVIGNGMYFLGKDSGRSLTPAQIMGLYVGYVFAPLAGIVGISVGIGGRHTLKKAVNLHNEEYISEEGYQKDQTSLDIGFTPNGVGFSLTF